METEIAIIYSVFNASFGKFGIFGIAVQSKVAESKEYPLLQAAHTLTVSQRSQLDGVLQATQPVPVVKLRVKPVLQEAQTFAELQRWQLEREQATQPTPLVKLQVWPEEQQPSAVLGRRLKVELQDAHLLAASHRSQFKLVGQATHPVPLVKLQV